MAATRQVITRAELGRLERLVLHSRELNELLREYEHEISRVCGTECCDFVEDVTRRDQPLAWMLERLGIEVDG